MSSTVVNTEDRVVNKETFRAYIELDETDNIDIYR